MLKIEMKFSAPDFEKALMESAVSQISQSVKNIRCSEHGEYARLLATGNSFKNLKLSVSGCCEHLINEVERNLE